MFPLPPGAKLVPEDDQRRLPPGAKIAPVTPAGPQHPMARFGENVLKSGGEFVGGIAQAVMDPVGTAKGMYNLGAGIVESAIPGYEGEHEKYATGALEHFKQRYGSPEQFVKTFNTDPIGTLSDFSMFATGGQLALKGAQLGSKAAGATRAAQLAGKGSAALGTVARATDPLQIATRVATAPLPAKRMYQSALKPGPGTYSTSEVKSMVQTGLEEGIPVSEAGSNKLWSLIEDLNTRTKEFTDAATKRGVTIDPTKVAERVEEIRPTFQQQVNPERSLGQLAESKGEFLRQHQTPAPYIQVAPGIQGGMVPVGKGTAYVPKPIPASEAQAIKTGTYRQLKKSYGELHNAQVEAQKALARGAKEELAKLIPEIGSLNARESKMLGLAPALEQAVRRQSGHQLFGIGTPLAAAGVGAATGSATAAGVAGIMRAIIDNPIVKSRLAIAIYRAQKDNPGRFGPARMTTATARVEEYLRALAQAQNAPQTPATAQP